jgi:hypothetical protein
MVIQTCNPSPSEAEAGESQVQGQPGIHSDFKTSVATKQDPVAKKQKNKGWACSSVAEHLLSMVKARSLTPDKKTV